MFTTGEFYLKGENEHTCVETSYTFRDTSRSNLFYCHGGWNGGRIATFTGYPIFAIVICTYDTILESRISYNRRSGSGWENLGDCAGVRFMWNGVCHQMANRLLWACPNQPTLNDFPFAISTYSTTRFLYGVYGNAGTARWTPYINECYAKYIAMHSWDQVTPPNATFKCPTTLDGMMAKLESENQGYGEALLNRFELMLEDVDMAVANGRVDVAGAIKAFNTAGHRDEPGYAENALATPEAHQRYMQDQDKEILKLLSAINDSIGENKYRTLFGRPFDPKFAMSSLMMDAEEPS